MIESVTALCLPGQRDDGPGTLRLASRRGDDDRPDPRPGDPIADSGNASSMFPSPVAGGEKREAAELPQQFPIDISCPWASNARRVVKYGIFLSLSDGKVTSR